MIRRLAVRSGTVWVASQGTRCEGAECRPSLLPLYFDHLMQNEYKNKKRTFGWPVAGQLVCVLYRGVRLS